VSKVKEYNVMLNGRLLSMQEFAEISAKQYVPYDDSDLLKYAKEALKFEDMSARSAISELLTKLVRVSEGVEEQKKRFSTLARALQQVDAQIDEENKPLSNAK